MCNIQTPGCFGRLSAVRPLGQIINVASNNRLSNFICPAIQAKTLVRVVFLSQQIFLNFQVTTTALHSAKMPGGCASEFCVHRQLAPSK